MNNTTALFMSLVVVGVGTGLFYLFCLAVAVVYDSWQRGRTRKMYKRLSK